MNKSIKTTAVLVLSFFSLTSTNALAGGFDKYEVIKRLDEEIQNNYKEGNNLDDDSPATNYQKKIQDLENRRMFRELRRKVLYPNDTYYRYKKKYEREDRNEKED